MQTHWLTCCIVSLFVIQSGCSKGCGKRSAGMDRGDGRIPTLHAGHVTLGAIRIDGRLDEPAWKATGSTGPFVLPGNGREPHRSLVKASARLAWDDTALYVGCVVHDKNPTSPFHRDARDPHLWKRSSAIELMIQPGDPGHNRDYYEIQVDVAGAVWDTRFDDYNRPIGRGRGRGRGPNQPLRYGHQEWSAQAQRAIVVDPKAGTYTVELALPWASFRHGATRHGVALPPKNGDTWRINLYSFRDGQRAALAWSPLLGQGNFHRAARFGRVVFSTAK